MIKEYTPDPRKVEEFEARRKKREQFQEKKPIRRILYVIGILALILPAMYFYYNRDEFNVRSIKELFNNILAMELLIFFVVWTPIIIYCKMSYGLGGFPPYYRNGETLVLYEDRLKNGFSYVDDNGKEWYMVYEIKYTDIKDILHDIVFENLEVYCKADEAIYDRGGTTLCSKKTMEKGNIIFYLYFNDNKDFLETLSSRSGVQIRRYNRNKRGRRSRPGKLRF